MCVFVSGDFFEKVVKLESIYSSFLVYYRLFLYNSFIGYLWFFSLADIVNTSPVGVGL
jgi:hypothetical protein